MKQLYFLLILTLSFGVYSQGIFTYNFDDVAGAANNPGWKTAIDASESSWGGDSTGDANQRPNQAGYMGALGTDATSYPGCVDFPGTKTAAVIYSQRFPNTTTVTGQGAPRDPAKSLGLNSGKVHLTVAFKAWKITNGSNNELEVRLQNSDAKRLISVRLQQHKVSGAAVDDQLRFVGVTYNNTTSGQQKTAGLFPLGSENTTAMVLGATIDFDAGTWEFWTDAPGASAGLASTQGGISGTFGAAGTNTLSISDQTVDNMTIMVKGNQNGINDYFIIDQIKVSGPNYVNTLTVNEFEQSSLVIYPNPADNFVVLQNAKVGDKLDLYDVVGKKVRSFNVESESQQLDISDLKTGVYFARSNQLEAIKIIKR